MELPLRRLKRRRSNHHRGGKCFCIALLLVMVVLSSMPLLCVAESPRIRRDLLALYTFDEGEGVTIQDRSQVGQRLDLKIDRQSAVKWKQGALVISSSVKIVSTRPATRIIQAIRRSGELTVEAWVKPRTERQSGPARIVSLSPSSSKRNVTLGQDAGRYDARLRTTSTSSNGIPSTATPNNTVRVALTHVVFTRDKSGTARIFVNGKQRARKRVAGRLSNWEESFPLLLANEETGNRPWLGELHLVAMYSRALSEQEVLQNFVARGDLKLVKAFARNQHANFFETKVAPLLARHCLDCHDPAQRKGELDLSRKESAFAGGESGPVIVPGKSAESLLWDQVSSGDMPPEGGPLSDEAKAVLRKWIDDGATWSLDAIDPAIYAHDQTAGQTWVRRLTVGEYIETVRSAVGVDISREALEILPPDLRADGFSNTAYNLNVDLKHVEAYARLANLIVERMDVLEFAQRFSKSRSLSTDNTMRKFVAAMGEWLLRGPLDDREITNFCGIATTVASAKGNYREAVSLTIEAMLQSPRFIYRIEDQRGEAELRPVSNYELASRMSYIIWGGPPDRKLMQGADSGDLQDLSRVQAEVERMLKDPRAKQRSADFVSEWLNLDRLQNMQPDPTRFPDWEPALAGDMRAETLAFFEDLIWKQRRPLGDLLNANFTYATPRLARHYGFTPQDAGLSRYDLSQVPARGGLLTQGSVLTVGGDDASMVTRGLFVLHDILRGTVKDPPPGLDTTPVPSEPGRPQRSISEERIGNVACGGCHAKFEPLAFGLEKFDGLGAYREKDEHGNQMREDGEILFPGSAKPLPYETSAELMDLLANSDRVRESITSKLTQFALGRPLVAADAQAVKQIHQAAQEDGGTYASLINAIVTSDLVMMARTEAFE